MKKQNQRFHPFNIGKQWKKWMAVSCSHGDCIDADAMNAVLTFRDRFKPDTVIHLGDFVDMTAARSGAIRDTNSSDHARIVADDLCAGIGFLQELAPQHVLYGNHEDRLFSLANSPNALLAHAATLVIQEIEEFARAKKIQLYPYAIDSYAQLGDIKFSHGHMYNVAAIRDHAETLGDCVIGHLHRVGMEKARNISYATGYCVGMLMEFMPNYAKGRRATLAWSQGFGYGYYSDTHTTVNLCERKRNTPWLLPL